MDRQAVPPPPPLDYAAAAMAYAQQQQQQQRPPPTTQQQQQQQQFGFPPQHQQQFGQPSHFMPPHPSMQQQFPYPHHLPPQQQQHPISSQLHGHAPPPPTPPHLLHQQHAPPHPYPAHYPPHLVPAPFHGPYDSAPPPAPPPADPELHKRIDKLVEYATKNGPEFELMIREKQKDNPEYRFLFGGEGHGYYRHKLWLSTRLSGGPFVPSFPPASSMPMMNPASNPMMNLVPQMQQPPFPPFYDPQQLHHHQPQSFGAHSRPDFDPSSGAFKVRPGLLPPDVAMELDNMLNTLNGTKESIKSTKMWFMQRSSFALALAEALRDKIFSVDDSERQLHIIYLANDILFDSLQRRTNVRDIDKEALAFKPVMGAMLARVYHNPQNKDENQSRLQKILQFWASKEVYDQDTIKALEAEMVGGAMTSFSGPPKEVILAPAGTMAGPGFQHASQWQPDRQGIVMDQDLSEKQVPPLFGKQQFVPSPTPAVPFQGSMLINSSVQSAIQHPPPHILQQPPNNTGEKLPPYPLFPPGLIPGMVRKMQIGSGVPYSPLSPLDIPTMIPPSDVSQSEILHRVSKFFKEIGEVNPSEGPMNSNDEYDDYERDSPVRKGGACIPPPPNLQVDPETGTYPDGSVERKPAFGSSGRLGLGATADPNEVSQYDDVYTSYRKKRSTNYHSSMSARAGTK